MIIKWESFKKVLLLLIVKDVVSVSLGIRGSPCLHQKKLVLLSAKYLTLIRALLLIIQQACRPDFYPFSQITHSHMTLFQKLVWSSSSPFKIKFTSLKKAGMFKPRSCRKSVTSWSQFSIHSGRPSWLYKIPLLLFHRVWRMRGCNFHPKCMKLSARKWKKEKLVKFISNTLQVTHIGLASIK